MDLAELRSLALFDGLTEDQLGELLRVADERRPAGGETLFQEGTPADEWWVLLEGAVALSRRVGTEETTMGMMTNPGQWAGKIGAPT